MDMPLSWTQLASQVASLEAENRTLKTEKQQLKDDLAKARLQIATDTAQLSHAIDFFVRMHDKTIKLLDEKANDHIGYVQTIGDKITDGDLLSIIHAADEVAKCANFEYEFIYKNDIETPIDCKQFNSLKMAIIELISHILRLQKEPFFHGGMIHAEKDNFYVYQARLMQEVYGVLCISKGCSGVTHEQATGYAEHVHRMAGK